MYQLTNTELSSPEETRSQFNGSTGVIKLGIDVHQQFYTVVMQEGGSNPKPPQRFSKEGFLHWAAKLKNQGNQVHAVYEACGFGFGLQRKLSALGIECEVVCPQKGFVGLDWARPSSSSKLIALIKLSGRCRTDRSTSRWKQNQRAKKEEEASQNLTLNLNRQTL